MCHNEYGPYLCWSNLVGSAATWKQLYMCVQVLVGQPWAQLLDPDPQEEHVSNAASGTNKVHYVNTGIDLSIYQTCCQPTLIVWIWAPLYLRCAAVVGFMHGLNKKLLWPVKLAHNVILLISFTCDGLRGHVTTECPYMNIQCCHSGGTLL